MPRTNGRPALGGVGGLRRQVAGQGGKVAVPKHKKSRARTASRRANWKSEPATYSECPQCHKPKLPHRVCDNCGYYAGRQAVEAE